MLKIRTSPPEERKTTPMNAIHVQINENIRMLAKLKERWDREKEEEERIKSLPTHHTVATIQVVEDVQTISTIIPLVHLDLSMVMLPPQP